MTHYSSRFPGRSVVGFGDVASLREGLGAGREIRRAGGFTLVELLVVIAIITLLMSLLMPALQQVRDRTKAVVCTTNLRSVINAAILYEAEHGGQMPYANNWRVVLPPYLGVKDLVQADKDGDPVVPNVFTCPVQFAALPYRHTYAINVRIWRGTAVPDRVPTTRTRALRDGDENNFIPLSASTLPYFLDGYVPANTGVWRTIRDSTNNYKNQINPELWPICYPHLDGCNIGFVDGHVARFMRTDAILSSHLLYADGEWAW